MAVFIIFLVGVFVVAGVRETRGRGTPPWLLLIGTFAVCVAMYSLKVIS